jgi:hypothetical protein
MPAWWARSRFRAGDVDPVWFVLDAERAAVLVEGFDEGGADPAHGVEHEIAGRGVVGDGVGGHRGQHLGRVRGRLSDVAAFALGGRRGLRGGPHRHGRRRGHRLGCGRVRVVDDCPRGPRPRPVEGGLARVVVGVLVSYGSAFLEGGTGVGVVSGWCRGVGIIEEHRSRPRWRPAPAAGVGDRVAGRTRGRRRRSCGAVRAARARVCGAG